MRILFTFYVPSGGVETLNRLRCESLQKNGIECHVLYLMPGSGTHNSVSFPVFITSQDEDIRAILNAHHYDAIIVTSDYLLLERLRRLGYGGLLIYESQGLGTRSEARNVIIDSVPYLQSFCNAVLIPPPIIYWSCLSRSAPGSSAMSFRTLWMYKDSGISPLRRPLILSLPG